MDVRGVGVAVGIGKMGHGNFDSPVGTDHSVQFGQNAHDILDVFQRVSADHFGDRVVYAESPLNAAQHADALLLLTEWNEFRNPSWPLLERMMRGRSVFDGRNIWDPEAVVAAGFEYTGIGRLA